MTHVADDMEAGRRHEFGFGRAMGWLFFLSSMFWSRLFILAWWIFSDLLGRAYSTALIPIVGFFVLPWTTLVYALCWSGGHRVYGFDWFLVGIAFLIDLGTYMGSDRFRRQRA